MNLENSNITKLPVKKEIATFNVPILGRQQQPATLASAHINPNGVANLANHRKHSFTPYSLNINNMNNNNNNNNEENTRPPSSDKITVNAVTQKPPEPPQHSSRLPAPSKILRYGSKVPAASASNSKLHPTANLKTFTSNRNESNYMNAVSRPPQQDVSVINSGSEGVSISIKREDSAYCSSSTSSTVSSSIDHSSVSGGSEQLVCNDQEATASDSRLEVDADGERKDELATSCQVNSNEIIEEIIRHSVAVSGGREDIDHLEADGGYQETSVFAKNEVS
jgi:hypothetical protein